MCHTLQANGTGECSTEISCHLPKLVAQMQRKLQLSSRDLAFSTKDHAKGCFFKLPNILGMLTRQRRHSQTIWCLNYGNLVIFFVVAGHDGSCGPCPLCIGKVWVTVETEAYPITWASHGGKLWHNVNNPLLTSSFVYLHLCTDQLYVYKRFFHWQVERNQSFRDFFFYCPEET